jgi:Thiamine monophosphate synthase
MNCLQYRVKDLVPSVQKTQIHELKELCAEYGVPFLINDGPSESRDWVGGSGWHVGEMDATPADWVRLAQQGWLGVSCYADEERAIMAERAGAHYVALGCFFPSLTKPMAPSVSFDVLKRVRRRLSIPIVAIGGMTTQRAHQLKLAGVDAVAVMSDLFYAADIQARAEAYCQVFA